MVNQEEKVILMSDNFSADLFDVSARVPVYICFHSPVCFSSVVYIFLIVLAKPER